MRYTVHIAFETDSSPTDLELGDLLTTVSENFQHPTSESPGGEFVPADYTIDSYDIELYDPSGRRIWRYVYGEELPDSMIIEHTMIGIVSEQVDDDWDNCFFAHDYDEIAIPPLPERDWRDAIRRFFGF
jgi:hypothetical protein